MALELLAYADESGIHDTAEWCLLSGWIGSPRQWEFLTSDWNTILKKYCIPDFHAQVFFSRDPQGRRGSYYRYWSEKQARRFIYELASAVQQHRVFPIGKAVNIKDFLSYSQGERKLLTGAHLSYSPLKITTSGAPFRPYQLGFILLLDEACRRTPNGAKVHFIFDRQRNESPRAIETFHALADYGRFSKQWEKLGNITYASAKDNIPLQIADLYVHAWYSFFTRGTNVRADRTIAMGILRNKRPTMQTVDKRMMEVILSQLLSPEDRILVQAMS